MESERYMAQPVLTYVTRNYTEDGFGEPSCCKLPQPCQLRHSYVTNTTGKELLSVLRTDIKIALE